MEQGFAGLKNFLKREKYFILTLPALFIQAWFIFIPSLIVLGLGLNYKNFFLLHASSYKSIFWSNLWGAIGNSISLAYLTAIFSFLFCMPIVLFINFQLPKKYQNTVLYLFMIPSWTNFITRIYSWFFLLKNDGAFAKTLSFFKILSEQDSMFAGSFATVLVMVYCYFPFMMMPLHNVVQTINKKTIESSLDLGANQVQTFFKIILPMSMQGILSGFFLVILSAFGEFTIPEFLGGGVRLYWGNLITSKFLFTVDYKIGCLIILVGLAVLFCALAASFILLGISLKLLSLFVPIPKKLTSLGAP